VRIGGERWWNGGIAAENAASTGFKADERTQIGGIWKDDRW
jgi:hypothetical protein